MDTKTCAACGKQFTRDPNSMSPARFAKRNACGIKCASDLKAARMAGLSITEYYRARHSQRTCLLCGKPIKRRSSESAVRYSQRKYCGSACSIHNASTHRLGRQPGIRPKTLERAKPQRRESPTSTVEPWEAPQRTRSPMPDPVPTRAAPTPPRPPESLQAALANALALHPELLQAITDPAFGLHIAGPNNGTGYGVGIRKARDKHRRTHA